MQTFSQWMESKADSFGIPENEPASPSGPLNALAGRMADNIRSGNTNLEDAKAYIQSKVRNPQDFNYVMEILGKHLA